MSDLRYAEDAAMFSKSRAGLESFAEALKEQSDAYGLKMKDWSDGCGKGGRGKNWTVEQFLRKLTIYCSLNLE